MNTITFRVFDHKNKKYTKDFFESDIDEEIVSSTETYSLVNTIWVNGEKGLQFSFELFAWEYDSDGVAIFAGDIIKCPKGRNDVIEFKNGGFWLKHRSCTFHHFVYVLKNPIEVIGNIHMNPELAEI
ncbi:YopX family protein [Christiangramia sp.]|uniref:YopX family protein n=1 Tax=Christiangramia sp. TaxID=1931228 RepID=UPI00263023F3|nr:YopX family protein [Christiangramia sp.]